MNAIQKPMDGAPGENGTSVLPPVGHEWLPMSDLFTELLNILMDAEDAGNWHLVHGAFYRKGRWMVAQSIEKMDVAALHYLSGLRDCLRAATECERIYGAQSLRKMGHPQNLLLSDIECSLRKNNPAALETKIPLHEPSMMADWATYDFTEAMRKISEAHQAR